jgi:hypothetical protein
MRKLAVLGLAVTLLLPASDAAGGDPGVALELAELELFLKYPSDWRPIDHPLTNCVDPVEVIDLAGPGGALFMLQETGTRGLPHRPSDFRLDGEPSPLGCCTPTSDPGWMVGFQESKRGFYAYLYPGRGDRRSEVLAILNSLEVSPR